MIRSVSAAIVLLLLVSVAQAQLGGSGSSLSPFEADLSRLQADAGPGVGKAKVEGLVENVYVIPYITGSYNIHSGKAFPKSASGLGFGGGIEFDLTQDGQKAGAMFDFAFQDMRAFATEGNVVKRQVTDTILTTADAAHYFQYLLLEGFLKLQGEKKGGYFLIGASLGYGLLMETQSSVPADPAHGLPAKSIFALWDETEYGTKLRIDIRAGLGLILANIGTHKLILEARFGYPILNAISNYQNIASGGDIGGWHIITLQANLGLRL